MLMEQSNNEYNNPFKYNGKELDEATGLYYYGARYYDPKTSIWLSVDPLAVYNPVIETEFYGDGQHNGGVFYSGNLNPYIYTYQNPIVYIDPNGKQTRAIKEVNVYAHTIVWGADGYVRYRNPQNDQTVNRIQSNNKLMNNWSGASEHKITIFLRGQNKSYTVNSQDVDPQHRATFVNDVSKLFRAYNGDKVRAFEQFADFMDPINKGLSVIGSFNKFIAALALPVTGTDILNEYLIGQEKNKYGNLKGKVAGTILNEIIGKQVEKKYGASGLAAYNVAIAPYIEKSLQNVAKDVEKKTK